MGSQLGENGSDVLSRMHGNCLEQQIQENMMRDMQLKVVRREPAKLGDHLVDYAQQLGFTGHAAEGRDDVKVGFAYGFRLTARDGDVRVSAAKLISFHSLQSGMTCMAGKCQQPIIGKLDLRVSACALSKDLPTYQLALGVEEPRRLGLIANEERSYRDK